MDVLERLILRRAERQLDGLIEAGERIVEFDNGTTPNGQKVQCVASTLALYVAVPGGQTARFPYGEVAEARSRSFWLSLELFSGAELLVDFRGSHRGLAGVVVEQCRPAVLQRA